MPDLRHLQPAVRTLAMPADTNPSGDIFGGWLLAQMDIAAGTIAYIRARGRVATVAVDAMTFHQPVLVGDIVSCYAEVIRVGRTSITMPDRPGDQGNRGQVHLRRDRRIPQAAGGAGDVGACEKGAMRILS
jgi:acyl-CoA thioesterase YciA